MIKELQQVEERARVVPPPEFAVPAPVWDAVRDWPTGHRATAWTNPIFDDHDQYLTCAVCDQAITIEVREGVPYRLAPEQVEGLTFAHLVQVHGWTREGAPDVV